MNEEELQLAVVCHAQWCEGSIAGLERTAKLSYPRWPHSQKGEDCGSLDPVAPRDVFEVEPSRPVVADANVAQVEVAMGSR